MAGDEHLSKNKNPRGDLSINAEEQRPTHSREDSENTLTITEESRKK